jgi:hypothetical protein
MVNKADRIWFSFLAPNQLPISSSYFSTLFFLLMLPFACLAFRGREQMACSQNRHRSSLQQRAMRRRRRDTDLDGLPPLEEAEEEPTPPPPAPPSLRWSIEHPIQYFDNIDIEMLKSLSNKPDGWDSSLAGNVSSSVSEIIFSEIKKM